ncbi:bifunctional polynucleotide phosphatase/kinase [Thraustotheca clavata]|uniref:Bifunctional polynucleotide phosphatase/kinase n=1 Tax=Thraustotheca clavata TaxID=74557 RepID=A0A1V9ZVQ6_9STRA|nr:bifunctional polynucleotide phosphatase/kinase [Thraustotheca clavata]
MVVAWTNFSGQSQLVIQLQLWEVVKMDKFVRRSPRAFLGKKVFVIEPTMVSKKQLTTLTTKIVEAGGKCVEISGIAKADIVVAGAKLDGMESHQTLVSIEWVQDCLAQKKLLPFPSNKRLATDLDSDEPSAKKTKTAIPAIRECTWATAGSIIWCSNFDSEASSNIAKIASFDMDSTLIATKSGKTFAVDDKDWKLWHENVPAKLKELLEDDYEIIVFSNQSGLSKGKVSEKGLKCKIEAIMAALKIPIRFFLLPENDVNRKPRTGAWEFMVSHFKMNVDMTSSFYCGDAAGRPKAPGKPKKDFSAGDYKFALNLGIIFKTPEQFFLGSKQSIHCDPKIRELDFDPRKLLEVAKQVEAAWQCGPVKGQEMIVLVGSPAAGKSTFCQKYFSDYKRINQDALKTPAKCKQACTESLKSGLSVVIDNTNRDVKTRREWITIAQNENIPVRCFYLDLPKPLVFHLNAYRALQKKLHPEVSELKSDVPDMVIHGFYKNMVAPTTDEGFASVVHVPFCALTDLKPEAAKLLTSFIL